MIHWKAKSLCAFLYVFLAGLFKDFFVYGTCYYLNEEEYSFQKQECQYGCCSDSGKANEICCDGVPLTAGAVVGITLGVVALVFAIVAIGITLWLKYMKKNKPDIQPQLNDNTSVRLHLNNSPLGSSRSLHADHDLPPPYSPSQSPRPSTRGSQNSPIEQLSIQTDLNRFRNLSPQPPPYSSTTQQLRSPRAGRLSPHVYNFQPSPSRSLAPSRAW